MLTKLYTWCLVFSQQLLCPQDIPKARVRGRALSRGRPGKEMQGEARWCAWPRVLSGGSVLYKMGLSSSALTWLPWRLGETQRAQSSWWPPWSPSTLVCSSSSYFQISWDSTNLLQPHSPDIGHQIGKHKLYTRAPWAAMWRTVSPFISLPLGEELFAFQHGTHSDIPSLSIIWMISIMIIFCKEGGRELSMKLLCPGTSNKSQRANSWLLKFIGLS